MGKERLTKLAADARDLVTALGGKIELVAVEETKLEAEATRSQKEVWRSCRRMIRKVVQRHEELQTLWAAC